MVIGWAVLILLSSFNLTEKRVSNKIFTQTNIKNHIKMKKINFKSDGLNLTGNLYYPTDFNENSQPLADK